MPELPEVQTVVTSLEPAVLRARIVRVERGEHDVCRPADFDVTRLTLRNIDRLHRRGKRIVFRLDDGNGFFVHLGMTGQLRIACPEAPVEKHTHLRFLLQTPGGVGELRFVDPRRFGGFIWLGQSPGDAGLGPEPLTIRPTQLLRELRRTRRHVKTALLDQRLIAGLGNIYVDEALHAARLHPLRRGADLQPPEVGRLTRAIKRILRTAIAHRGSTLRDYVDADGNRGGFQHRHKVYGREGADCRHCGGTVERIVLGGRGTHFCPGCPA